MKHSLLLLSGVLCDATIWSDIPQRLDDVADSSVLSFRGLDSIGAMAALVMQTAPPRFAVAGHSMGGRVALEIIRVWPERVLALGLLNSSVQAVREGEPQARELLVRRAAELGMRDFAAEWLPPMVGRDIPRSAHLLRRLSAMVERHSTADFAGQIRAMATRPEALSVLPRITVPTLLLSGGDDELAPMSQQESIRRKIPHATVFEIVGAGHIAPIERPDAVATALREWLKGISGN